jgi:hypothetical protein
MFDGRSKYSGVGLQPLVYIILPEKLSTPKKQ